MSKSGRALALLSAWACAVTSLVAASPEGSSPNEIVDRYGAPEVGRVVALKDQTVEVGHLRLTMKEGYGAKVVAGGNDIGMFFVGVGAVSYDSVNPDEQVVLRYNTTHATDLSVEETETGARLHGAVEHMLLLGSPKLLPELNSLPDLPAIDPNAPAESDGAVKIVGSAFKKHVKLISDDRTSPFSHFLLKHALDAADATVLRAELAGPAGDLCYVYDPFDRQSEMLYSLRRIRGSLPYGARWPVTVSEQALDREARDFKQPSFLLTDVDYTLVTDKENASLSVVETIVPFGREQTVFRFDLYNEFFDNYAKRREWRLKTVRDQQGREIAFHHERDELVVVLPEAAPSGQPFRIRFELEGRVLYRPNGDAYWMLGVAPWFPQPELGGQFYTVHSIIKVPKPFVPIAPGITVSRHEEGELNVLETKIDRPVQFAVAMAGKYTFLEETRDGILVRLASYASPKESAAKTLSNLAHKTIDYYQKFLGPFPFEEYNVVEINQLGWGQAPPGMMFITKEAFTPWFNQVWSQGINHRFAHEIAHQYWGHVVKMGSREEQWVTEAFSEYCSSFIVRQLRGKDGYRDLVADWEENAKVANAKASIPHANRIFPDDVEDYYDRKGLVYDKGALVLAALHEEIGDAAFASFLRSVQQGFAWKFASTQHMPMIIERITGEDHSELFEKYFWGTKMPRPPKVLKGS